MNFFNISWFVVGFVTAVLIYYRSDRFSGKLDFDKRDIFIISLVTMFGYLSLLSVVGTSILDKYWPTSDGEREE